MTQLGQWGSVLLTYHGVIFWKVCNRGQGIVQGREYHSHKKTLAYLRNGSRRLHIGGQSRYRALSSLLRASGSLQPSVKSNDCWNRKASAVEPPAGTVPSI
jgi:hypothetical protein